MGIRRAAVLGLFILSLSIYPLLNAQEETVSTPALNLTAESGLLQNALLNLYQTSFTFTLEGSSEAADRDSRFSHNFSAEGKADYTKVRSEGHKHLALVKGKGNSAYPWGSVDTTFAGETRYIAADSFIKVGQYDEAKSYGSSPLNKGEEFIRSYLGKWLKVPKLFSASPGINKFSVLPFDQYQRLSEAMSQITKLGDEVIEGKPMQHYQLKPGLEIDKVDYENFEVWIGKDDGFPYRIVSRAVDRNTITSGSQTTTDINLNLRNFGSPVEIDVPAGALSIQDIFSASIDKFRPELEKAQAQLQTGLQELQSNPELQGQLQNLPNIQGLDLQGVLKSLPQNLPSSTPASQQGSSTQSSQDTSASQGAGTIPSAEDVKKLLDKFKF
ncbi:MAG TPA: hypothetical protein VI976_02785 [Candidatus Omnitrophota bacterium]|nr:hypothetical protein [Candidatus Omnitrophota bacterium]